MRILLPALILPAALAAGCAEQGSGRDSGFMVQGSRSDWEPGTGDRKPAADLPAGASLPDYLQYAEERNPGVQAARQRWLAAKERAPQARNLPDPLLMYEYWGMKDTKQQMLTVSQTVPWPGKLALAGAAARKEAAAERQRYEAARLSLVYRVKTAWFEHWYLARAIEIAREDAALAGNIEEIARTRYKAGLAEFADAV